MHSQDFKSAYFQIYLGGIKKISTWEALGHEYTLCPEIWELYCIWLSGHIISQPSQKSTQKHSSLPKIELALGLINDIGNSPERADIVQKIFNNAYRFIFVKKFNRKKFWNLIQNKE